jgi:chromosome segregation ATPase
MLQSLELLGFKSFAEKTRLDFSKGITAIVGPNGSGKSNLVDAIKWVLGEQSAKSLRGLEMADVIFGGSSSRKAVSFAEVSLSFENSARRFDLDASQVTITRRVYRDGQGEYLLNGKSSRLKDLRKLYAESDAGNKAISVIEQGRVDAIVLANGPELRSILEDAAGTSKHRTKLDDAQKRLLTIEQSFQLLDQELRQKAKLRDQAEREVVRRTRHAEFGKHITELEQYLGQIEARDAQNKLLTEQLALTQLELLTNADREQLSLIQVDREQAQQKLDSLEARLTDARIRLGVLENRLRDNRQEQAERGEGHQFEHQQRQTMRKLLLHQQAVLQSQYASERSRTEYNQAENRRHETDRRIITAWAEIDALIEELLREQVLRPVAVVDAAAVSPFDHLRTARGMDYTRNQTQLRSQYLDCRRRIQVGSQEIIEFLDLRQALASACDEADSSLRIATMQRDDLQVQFVQSQRERIAFELRTLQQQDRHAVDLAEFERVSSETKRWAEQRQQARERGQHTEQESQRLTTQLAHATARLATLRERVKMLNLQVAHFADPVELMDIETPCPIHGKQPCECEVLDVAAIRKSGLQLLDKSRTELRHLGNINQELCESLESTAGRCTELTVQLKDATDARESLRGLVSDLMQQCEVQYSQFLGSVREHFIPLYQQLFSGGQAEIRTTTDPHTGQSFPQIYCCPPGKELKSMAILSGGERTLSAIALLLAIFRSRPTAFCLLDEVDAALDEANTARLAAALTECFVSTQFLIITHKRRVMAIANQLYGVTMQESGVSKVLSMRLDDASEEN